ncbi:MULTISPECIES: phosphate-starvation-inducible protein PsiE [Actinobacillus]|uniref:Protein PsiE n=1 Tax=Actinobacillus pleuropneumoniae serovar 6 str. Femo TaxID=754256 RepID=A0A828PH63_ACTPL|nr:MULTISPECIES: phosphate-starvation-inducible protein PsiE [Actinobacillus]EFL80954.1 phosphate-starvation-inducible protein PsiE [Actinobacillus pleuropneumoniae serovar 6 str. Femo]EFM90918.1 Predicted membrane protein [Actinobacillus pleuropneumoniae serovar 6 str. Femo]UKH12384.1 phosphate-starvation-inducible protein PsiE [Actinobacillus pleuropneumoniae serovar 6 str. Femo]WGE33886.1 phosphate-starvation-inducible protein PsiE [Actinobacillus genomosp. 1]WGE35931.1 phosphate-starvation
MPKLTLEEKHSRFGKFISEFFQWTLNLSLLVAGLLLSYSLFSEAYSLYELLANHSEKFQIVEKIVIFFLYFEFLALIVQYFKYNYHFPLRYFLYIGITAMVRLIIVDHSNAMHTLLFALSILVMIIALYLVHSDRLRKS